MHEAESERENGGRMAPSLSARPGQLSGAAAPQSSRDVRTEISCLLLSKLSARAESDESDLFHEGIFDSMSLVQFIFALEEHFRLQLPLEEIDTGDFASISKMAELIDLHLRRASAKAE